MTGLFMKYVQEMLCTWITFPFLARIRPECRIEMSSRTEKNRWHLHAENTCPPEEKRGREFLTWKPDPENHGIGLTILRDLVRENRGSITSEQSGGIFRTEISMPVKTDRKD